MSERIHWPIEDLASFEGSEEETLERFRRVRDEVAERIIAWLEELGLPAESEL